MNADVPFFYSPTSYKSPNRSLFKAATLKFCVKTHFKTRSFVELHRNDEVVYQEVESSYELHTIVFWECMYSRFDLL